MRRFCAVSSALFALAVGASGCKGRSKSDVSDQQETSTLARDPSAADGWNGPTGGANIAPAEPSPALPTSPPAFASAVKQEAELDDRRQNEKRADAPADRGGADEGKSGKKGGGGGKEQAAVATRAWFPETFLFEPLIVTDASGHATVPVRVPDRLTSWRVLALAHSRSGAQGGATTSFLGTLPAYVEPVVPAMLVSGDQVRLPIQLVNTTEQPIASALRVEVANATLRAAGGPRTLPARGSLVEYAMLTATRPGIAKLEVSLANTDAVRRAIEIRPAGRPVVETRSGTLAAPRTLAIEGPADADPETSRARLTVFPGALAVLRAELGLSLARGGLTDDAYALLLAGTAPALLTKLGDKPDPVALRELAIVAGQRAIRHGRTLDVVRATALTGAALAHAQNPVLVRLGERAAGTLARAQRPDGTFAGGAGWTLQRVLVATADATRATSEATTTLALRQAGQAVAFRARAAFERHLDAVTDGYTAAAILASGAVEGPVAATLRERVRAAIATAPDGAKYLAATDVVRADGSAPGVAEATALAVLALDGDATAAPLLADLGTTLLGSYQPARGWGDGQANLACMRATLALFANPVPANVAITLAMDGVPVATGTLAGDAVRDVLVLEGAAPNIAGAHQWTVTAEPPVPGLGYALAVHSYVPWRAAPTGQGVELALPAEVTASVGKPVELAVTAVAPSGGELRITYALPAGVQLDTPALQALVEAATISRYDTADGEVQLVVPPLAPGAVFAAKLTAIPTLAGTLHGGASSITAAGTTVQVPPTRWTVR